jgi:hypothetical protein
MIYVIEPSELTKDWCTTKCLTLCKGIMYPCYGVPPDEW